MARRPRIVMKDLAGRRAAVSLVVAAVIVLAILTVFAVELSDTQAKSRQDVVARVHERGALAAALFDSLLHSADAEVKLYQTRYGGRAVSNRILNRARGQNMYVALVTLGGRVLARSVGFTPQVRTDLRRSAALDLVRTGRTYGLGDLLPYGRTGVVNLAVRFSTRYGTRVFVTGFPPAALSGFLTGELRRIPGVRGAENFVIDGHDAVLSTTNQNQATGYRFRGLGKQPVSSQASGLHGSYYYDVVTIPNSTWRIVLAAPASRLFASVSGLRGWLPWLIFAAFALVAATALLLGARMLRSAETGLRDANSRLQDVNVRLEEANRALAHDALHDPLTGLPNRALLMDRLDQLLGRARRDSAIGCAVLFIDLDGFKMVNDSLSHAVGDLLLVAVARRFAEVLRPGDTVARLGGDEFAVLLDQVVTSEDATAVAERVHGALDGPFHVAGHELFVRASIGISLRSDGVSAHDLVRNADIAMYDVKRRGTGSYVIFDETMRQRVVDRLALETELRAAVEQSLIRVKYQPIVDLATGHVRGLEALARWPDGRREVPPAEFIAVAEASGLIRSLGHHVLRTALDDFASCREEGLVDPEVYLSVNISRQQLDDPALPEIILGALADSGVPPEALRLEITESTLMQEPQLIQRIVAEVCAHGVGLHLDDFGTQYSSLASLLEFPVVALKIDRGFVGSLTRRDHSTTIVRTIISLAHGLALLVIGEGIEDGDELRRLKAMGCDWGQGYLFARPLERDQMEEVLGHWSRRHSLSGA